MSKTTTRPAAPESKPEYDIHSAIQALEETPRGRASLRALRAFLSPTVMGLDRENNAALLSLLIMALGDFRGTTVDFLSEAATAGAY